MRIGIFGGSFNPPHLMHFQIGKSLIEKGYIDKVIYVPTGSKYKYKNNLVSDEHRYKMLEIMIGNDERFMVSDYEFKDYVVYTCDTLNYFKMKYPNDEIYFVCGADNLSYIDEWKEGVYLLYNYKLLVIKRDTNDINLLLNKYNKYSDNILVADVEMSSLSSTKIRKMLSNGEDVFDFVSSNVVRYIKENKLY